MGAFFLESHEWARQDDASITIGLSAFAAGEIGDVIHVELPAVGDAVTQGEPCGEIESVKSVNDIFAPVSGKVVAVNTALENNPELVNTAPLADGWLIKVAPSTEDPFAGLLDEAAYETHIRA